MGIYRDGVGTYNNPVVSAWPGPLIVDDTDGILPVTSFLFSLSKDTEISTRRVILIFMERDKISEVDRLVSKSATVQCMCVMGTRAFVFYIVTLWQNIYYYSYIMTYQFLGPLIFNGSPLQPSARHPPQSWGKSMVHNAAHIYLQT